MAYNRIKLVDYSMNSTLFDDTAIGDIEECSLFESSVEQGIFEESTFHNLTTDTLIDKSTSDFFHDDSLYFDCTLNNVLDETIISSEEGYKTAKSSDGSIDENLERTQTVNEIQNQSSPPTINKTYTINSPEILTSETLCTKSPKWTSTPVQVDDKKSAILSNEPVQHSAVVVPAQTCTFKSRIVQPQINFKVIKNTNDPSSPSTITIKSETYCSHQNHSIGILTTEYHQPQNPLKQQTQIKIEHKPTCTVSKIPKFPKK